MKELTKKEKRFADEYLIDLNGAQAAIRAGYSKNTARAIATNILRREHVAVYVQKRLDEKDAKLIAKQDEVLQYLTSVLRGESTSEVVVVEGCGDGCSEAIKVQKAPDEKEKLKAAELLGKRYGIYTEKIDMTARIPVFEGEKSLED